MKNDSDAFHFDPPVPFDLLPDAASREDAIRMVKLMTPETAKTLEIKVTERRKLAFSACDLGEMETAVAQHWMIENYFHLMAEVLQECDAQIAPCPQRHPLSVEDSKTREDTDTIPSMFVSPKKGFDNNTVTRTGLPAH